MWKNDGNGNEWLANFPGTPSFDEYHPSRFTAVGDSLAIATYNAQTRQWELWWSDGTAATTGKLSSPPGCPNLLTAAGDRLYFSIGVDIWSSGELWSTRGWSEEPAAVPLDAAAEPISMLYTQNALYFMAGNREIWKIDGTPPRGSELTLFPGNPWSLAATGGWIYVMGGNESDGDLWQIDPITGGASDLWDANPELDGLYPDGLCPAGDLLYFLAWDDGPEADGHHELWVVNQDGPRKVQALNGNAYLSSLTSVGSDLYFVLEVREDAQYDQELWTSDGALVRKVFDSIPGPEPAYPRDLTAVGSLLFFSADVAVGGRELWRTDGNQNTWMVQDIANTNQGSAPFGFADFQGTSVFLADDGINGSQLWQSDGTEQGTSRISDFTSLNPAGSPVAFGTDVYFPATDGFWKSDLISGSSVRLANVSMAGLPDMNWTVHDDKVLFWGYGPDGWGLNASDSAFTQTTLLKAGFGSGKIVDMGDFVYFSLYDSIWRTDGTPETTTLVTASWGYKEMARSGESLYFTSVASAMNPQAPPENSFVRRLDTASGSVTDVYVGLRGPRGLKVAGGKAYFGLGSQLWMSDEGGTYLVADTGDSPSSLYPVAAVGNVMYFADNNGVFNNTTLWKTDGTPGQAERLADISGQLESPMVIGDSLFFFAGVSSEYGELWQSDSVGTRLVARIPGLGRSNPSPVGAAIGDTLYFAGADGRGSEPWVLRANQPPVPTITGPTEGVVGQTQWFTLTATDTNPRDRAAGYVFGIDWNGDDEVEETVTGPSGTSVSHVFDDGGSQAVKVTATDRPDPGIDAKLSQAVSHTIQIRNVEVQGDNLAVYGNSVTDVIDISASSDGRITVQVNSDSFGPFTVAGQVLVDGRKGNDSYTVNLGNWQGTVNINDTGISDDRLTVVGVKNDDNSVTKTTGKVVWTVGTEIIETVNFSGIDHLTLVGGSERNIVVDPDTGPSGLQDTTIVAGPAGSFNSIQIADTTAAVVIQDGGGSNAVTIDMGNLGAPVTIQGNTGATTVTITATSDLTLTAAGVISGGEAVNFISAPPESIAVDFGTGINTVYIKSTPPAPVAINATKYAVNTYIVDLGSLAGPVAINDVSGAGQVQVNAPASATSETTVVTLSEAGLTSAGETITFGAVPPTSIAVTGSAEGGGHTQVVVDGTPPAPVTVQDAVLVEATCALSGVVWVDFNDDGEVDFSEKGLAGVQVHVQGTDILGRAVDRTGTTDSDGAFNFLDLLPGAYSIARELIPPGYVGGKAAVGTAGGQFDAADAVFRAIGLGIEQAGVNYNFGELPAPGAAVTKGQSAGLGFWQNKNGQELIRAFDGGPQLTVLGNWLAATLPSIFGVDAGGNNLAGQTNAEIAAAYQKRFLVKGVKLDAQVMATALSVYATCETLGGNWAAAYGFAVSQYGLAYSTYQIGANGLAFDAADNTVLTVMQILESVDRHARSGVLYGDNATLRKIANSVLDGINRAGDLV